MGTRSRSEHSHRGMAQGQEDAVFKRLLFLWLASLTLGKVTLLL